MLCSRETLISPERRIAVVQHWSTYLIPCTCRIVLTLGIVAENLNKVIEYEGEIAGPL